MKAITIRKNTVATLLAIAAACGLAQADPLIKEGDVVGIVGDSITEQKAYSMFIENYLLMCQPVKVRAIQFGWSGEQVVGLNSRISDVLMFKPTLVTTCYGMNDGHYTTITDEIRKTYREATQKMVKSFTDSGARVILGSPGAVDTGSYKNKPTSADVYNENLAALGEEDKKIAADNGLTFADVHTPMIKTMDALKVQFGPDYQVAGGDGVHPGPNGHLIMAYAFLKAMGFDGNIGEYNVDLKAHTATVTGAGQKLVKVDGNSVVIESSVYPFCFAAPAKPNDVAAAAVLDFLPFNSDLNRLMLKVTTPPGKFKVTWGKTSKTYTAAQLGDGINLAAEFLDNPFTATFLNIQGAVFQKQSAETGMIKGMVHDLHAAETMFPEKKDSVEDVMSAIGPKVAKAGDDLHALVKPITHTITIEAAQ